jgi:predicted glycogen debranching enzyme
MGLPIWTYEVEGVRLEKRVTMAHLQNTTHVSYHLLSDQPVRLELRPLVAFRLHEAPVNHPVAAPYALQALGDRFEIVPGADLPPLRLFLHGEEKAFTVQPETFIQACYGIEQNRGYECQGDLWTPGYFRLTLAPGSPGTLVASTESWETIGALNPAELPKAEQHRRRRLLEAPRRGSRSTMADELILAADQFIITPAGRIEEAARARAAGDEVRTVIAGYHWFTDWGRDTMISLEGLTLCTGRQREAGYILRTFGHYVRDGLIPNMFPEGTKEGLYHTADATLWFFHALHRYVEVTGDRETLRQLLPKMKSIVEHHVKGTRFGIGVDAGDGLLRQGAEGYQLTWMDAKVDDWVVTPRRGKAVEINALWYNALRLLQGWLREEGDAAAIELEQLAARTRESFNQRFWYAEGGYLYDVIDGEQGDDTACRPNQVMAISLDHPVLDEARWRPVFEVVRDRLATDVGLRSLAPGHRDYKAQYYGDLRARRRLPPGHRLGLAGRPVRGRLAEAQSRGQGRRARTPRRVRAPHGRGRHRHAERDLRRRGALHPARVHRPSVERGRGAESVATDGGRLTSGASAPVPAQATAAPRRSAPSRRPSAPRWRGRSAGALRSPSRPGPG